MRRLQILSIAGLLAIAGSASAHRDEQPSNAKAAQKKEQKPWGIAGEAGAAHRTIRIEMLDSMRFVPDRIEVRQGETVRFVHHNSGRAMHEFVLGTKAELDEHSALMKKFPGMEHHEPYMAHVPAGKAGEVVWTFNRAGEFMFACLIPGHYEAGMTGRVTVVTR